MKTILAALVATVALLGVAHAETVTGTIRSVNPVTGTIYLENGKAYGISRSQDESERLVQPMAPGTPVTLRLDDATQQVTDIFGSGPGYMGMRSPMGSTMNGTDDTMTSSPY